ncbi:MAG TPA: exopolyphosphatase [Jiangellaceae bacterium]|nr:exopolyphosphatase [Jiangellaceae bacterium]
MTRVAAVDCGTNSIRLLIADVDARAGTQQDLERELRIVRLGQDVDRAGSLAPEAIERTKQAMREYAELVEARGVDAMRMVTTSAVRDATNRDVFFETVRNTLHVEPEVVSGEEEARLTFTGATRDLPAGHRGSALVVDIGGGSTELVQGDGEPTAVHSMNIGSVRVTERHLSGDPPPSDFQVRAATAEVDVALDTAETDVALAQAKVVVGVAGTVTTLAALHADVVLDSAGRVHHHRLPDSVVDDLARWLLARRRDEIAELPAVHPGRVDVIAGGALVLQRVLRRTAATEVVVSESDILDGLAWSAMGGRDA